MAKSKHYVSMSKRANIVIVAPTSKSQKAARTIVREEFSPQVKVETNPKSYLVAFKKKSPTQSSNTRTIASNRNFKVAR